MQEASTDALGEMYLGRNKYNSFMDNLTKAANNNIVAKIMIPFMKIGTQITRKAFIESTPLGLASADVRALLQEGGAARQMTIAKMTAGTALVGAAVTATLEGMMTGDGPEDPKARAAWLLNHRPNTLTIGNISIPYQGLGYIGMLMRFAANMTETASYWGEEDHDVLAKAFFQGITKSVLDDNWMKGAHDALDAVYHMDEYGEKFLQEFATNWLPYSVGLQQVAREVDPFHRIAHDVFDAARRHIPVVSETLFPQRDMFGAEIRNDGPLPDYADDRVVLGLEALHTGIGKLPQTIRGVQLTPEQYDGYSALAGQLTHLQLSGIMTPEFQQMPRGVQINTINKVVGHAREIARKVTMAENPSIIRAALEGKRAELLSGKRGKFIQAETEEAEPEQQAAESE